VEIVSRAEGETMRTATNNNTQVNNAVVIAMTKEEITMMTKNELRVALEAVGVEMNSTTFKRTKKAELVSLLEKYLDPSKKVDIVVDEIPESAKYPINPLDDPEVQDMDVSDEALLPAIETAPVVEEKVTEKTEKKEVSDMKQKYLDAKWDKLVKAVATEYVKQCLGVKWALFYKNTKATATKAEYLVKTKKLWGATSKVIKNLYGEQNCNEGTIQQTLNAMVVRGYLNYQKVQGNNGVNIIFNATADQMNAMWKLSK
jgi:uncharacterized protein (DUF2164 family)